MAIAVALSLDISSFQYTYDLDSAYLYVSLGRSSQTDALGLEDVS